MSLNNCVEKIKCFSIISDFRSLFQGSVIQASPQYRTFVKKVSDFENNEESRLKWCYFYCNPACLLALHHVPQCLHLSVCLKLYNLISSRTVYRVKPL